MTMRTKRLLGSLSQQLVRTVMLVLALIGAQPALQAAGVLTAKGSPDAPIRIKDHHLGVTINNGFARTEVTQTFFNPNPKDLEAIYSFPVPQSASLSEVTLWIGEKEINGEVIEKQEAQRIYKEEREKGHDSGIADKNGYQTFDFGVSPVRANSDVRIRFVYYQPLQIDTGIGKYVYPLRDGGTDEAATDFWSSNSKVDGTLSAHVTLKSAWPLTDVRVPNVPEAIAQKLDEKQWQIKFEKKEASLDRDLVVYYKLADNLPGRVEVLPYRADKSKPGSFMMVVTPGVDLKPITGGADYTFVLDVSGSMQQKLPVLVKGVVKVLGQMQPTDRFRVITFNTSAREVIGWETATPDNVKAACEKVQMLRSDGSTNLYDGIRLALSDLDADRATSIILVTDGVTNTGIVDPTQFHTLMKQYDVRIFGFLMGNSANWPLVRTICDATGGFYAGVSNDDDIIGQIMLAKSKITAEAMHDASIKITGVETENVTDRFLGKIYRGQQLVLFGQYDKPGKATFTLKARLTGEDKTYTTAFDFPEIDKSNPEVERLFAMNQIELAEGKKNSGELSALDMQTRVRELGLKYQIVTDYTSMVVLADEAFTQHGIARDNQARVTEERAAQSVRSSQPAANTRVDQNQPAFSHPAPGLTGSGGGSGGGAIDPRAAIIVALLIGVAFVCFRNEKSVN